VPGTAWPPPQPCEPHARGGGPPAPRGAGPLPWARDSLFAVGGAYRPRPNGDLLFAGTRPGPDWHAHGYTPRRLALLKDGHLVRRRLWKPRWRHRETGETRHSRPPDDVASVRACTLVVVLKLWAWVSSAHGLLRRREALASLQAFGAARTVQRWMRRALPLAERTEHAFRFVLVEKSEPRPLESLFDGGLSPPVALSRSWRRPAAVSTLSRALASLLVGASRLHVPAARLLAGARGSWTGPDDHFVI